MTSLMWFRRDLRTGDHPALAAAAEAGPVLGVYVLDDLLLARSGTPRAVFLYRCLAALNEQLNGRLLLLHGDPVEVLPKVAAAVGAESVHVSSDAGPYGRRRDMDVEKALSGDFVRTGSPYAVTPGRIHKSDGTPYRVFTPFSKAWREHGWRAPADSSGVEWIAPDGLSGVSLPEEPELAVQLPAAGEAAAMRAWQRFCADGLTGYASNRNNPAVAGTSMMSAYLRWGCIHPRTMLADLPADADIYRNELCWREFYADVLWNWPDSARQNFNTDFDNMEVDANAELFEQWCAGRTGYPIVDAGMRQLLAEGWMHNRVRMIVASFLVKDLHLPWRWGARHFMRHLVDGDLASNQHGWQWVAGSGTDAAPYFRIFNPTTQGERFDPHGDYVRRYVPELADIPGKKAHHPWKLPSPPADYPPPLVDHAEERQISLTRYGARKS